MNVESSSFYIQHSRSDLNIPHNTGGRNSGSSLSPLIDLSGIKDKIRLNFWTRWQHESYPSGNYDNMKVEIWDSQKWNRIFYNDCNEGPSVMDWHEESFDISNYAGKKIKLRFNFDTVDGWYNDYEGWYIDDVKIIKGEDKPVYVPLGTISYIYANDELVARVDKKPAQSEKVYYYHNDYLGSTRVMTDSMGEIVWSSDYLPFGELINTEGKIENNFTFTGKEYDEATGLYYFGARYYDPKVGRFITKDPMLEPVVLQTLPVPFEDILEDTIDSSSPDSPDFIVPYTIYTPEDFHPYTYCYNDPLNWIDSFGLCPEEPGLESTWDELMLIPGLGLVSKGSKWAVKFMRYKNAGGGGLNFYKNGKRVFGIDWHKWGKEVNKFWQKFHYHSGKTKSQLKKHRPWER